MKQEDKENKPDIMISISQHLSVSEQWIRSTVGINNRHSNSVRGSSWKADYRNTNRRVKLKDSVLGSKVLVRTAADRPGVNCTGLVGERMCFGELD